MSDASKTAFGHLIYKIKISATENIKTFSSRSASIMSMILDAFERNRHQVKSTHHLQRK